MYANIYLDYSIMETFISSLQIELLVELLNEDSLFFYSLSHSLTHFIHGRS